MTTVRTLLKRAIAAAIGTAAMIAAAPTVLASNHSDAPLIKQDPQANLTDVYAFIGTQYNNPSIKVLNVSMSFRPFSEPGDGAQYERFADDARYSIHITDPTSGDTKMRYDFMFSPVDEGYKNKNTVHLVRPRHRGRSDRGGRRCAPELHADVSSAESERRAATGASAPSCSRRLRTSAIASHPLTTTRRRARQFRARRRWRISTSTRVRPSTRCALARWSGPVIAMTASIPTSRESSIC